MQAYATGARRQDLRRRRARRADAHPRQPGFPVSAGAAAGRQRARATSIALDDLQLASRLSFFLWSSLPDDELLEVAASGRLSDDAVLEQQVRRMLADPRAQSLARDFAFQWLGMAKLADIEPDPSVFPYAANHRDIDGDLREDFREEIRLFVDSVFRGNRSVLELMNGDYTFLNERLAVHYGIRDVKGVEFPPRAAARSGALRPAGQGRRADGVVVSRTARRRCCAARGSSTTSRARRPRRRRRMSRR